MVEANKTDDALQSDLFESNFDALEREWNETLVSMATEFETLIIGYRSSLERMAHEATKAEERAVKDVLRLVSSRFSQRENGPLSLQLEDLQAYTIASYDPTQASTDAIYGLTASLFDDFAHSQADSGVRISVDPVAVMEWEEARISGADRIAQQYVEMFDRAEDDIRKITTKLHKRKKLNQATQSILSAATQKM